VPNWRDALNWFAIEFADRMPTSPPKLQSADLLLQKNFDTPQFAAMVEEFAGIFIGSDLLIESVA